MGNQFALLGIFRLIGQGRQRPLQGQARHDQATQLTRPDRQGRRVEHPAGKQHPRLAFSLGHDHIHLEWHQMLRAQLRTRCFGVIRLDQTGYGLASGIQGFKTKRRTWGIGLIRG